MENNFEAKASVKNIGVTPRKTRLVIDMVRGKSLLDARAILKNVNKAACPIVLKLINSAAANAVNNKGL
ncbi:TPA: 50S ribosomal protein L22, partial [bacterium]|nr:50S ribosomal protein L22 [bacterium]